MPVVGVQRYGQRPEEDLIILSDVTHWAIGILTVQSGDLTSFFFSKFVKTKIIFGANLSNRPEQDLIILRDVIHTVQRTIGMVIL